MYLRAFSYQSGAPLMQCSSCGTLLPSGATFCPTCGTATSYAIPSSETPPYGSPSYDASPQGASPPSPYDASPQPPAAPFTDYGAPPYGFTEPAYGTFNPYEVSVPPPPPPPSQ